MRKHRRDPNLTIWSTDRMARTKCTRTPEQKERNRIVTREYYARIREQNPEKIREYQRKWREAHREKTREYNRKWYERTRAEHPDQWREKWKQKRASNLAGRRKDEKRWRDANIEKHRQADREEYKKNREAKCAKSRRWRAENPEKWHELQRVRRARKLGAGGTHTLAEIRGIFDQQGGLCAGCQIPLVKTGKGKYHVDHIQPISRGGSDDASNLQLLCPPCNYSKSAKDPYEWAKERGLLFV